MKKRFKYSIKGLLSCLLITLFTSASGQKAQFGKGISMLAEDSSMYVKFTTRFQSLYMGSVSTNAKDIGNDFGSQAMIRRARLKFDGWAFNPNVVYKIELGLSNRDIGHGKSTNSALFNYGSNLILDAVIKYKMGNGFQLWFGQTKLPGNRERVISSADLQFVDRSRLNSEFNIDRDFGFQIHHKWKAGGMEIREAVAITSGEGRNVTMKTDGNYSYTGRMEIFPLGGFSHKKGAYFGADLDREESPKIAIGMDYNVNYKVHRSEGQTGDLLLVEDSMLGDFGVMHIDMMFKYKGFSLMTEYGAREALYLPADENGNEINPGYVLGEGFNTQLGYLCKANWEVSGRYTEINRHDKGYTMYTLGLSKYVSRHNLKFQSDISYTDKHGSDSGNLMFRLQSELQF